MKTSNSFTKILDAAFTKINACNPYLLVFIVICGHLLSFSLATNDEAYFPLAKQFINPDWMPNSFVFGEWAGTRLLYQYLIGFALKFMSFEQLAFWGRLVTFIITTIPLTKLFKQFNFSNVTLLIALELFLIRPSWVGGEYIFGGTEAKTFAYIFILYAISSLFKKKYMQVTLFAIFASYFHILVGGWFMVFALSYILIYERSLLQPLKLGVIFSIALSPFLYFLTSNIAGEGSGIINGVNIDWVYSFYRNPHHCVPLSRPDWMTVVLPSLIQIFISCILLVTVLRKKRGQLSDQFFWMMLVIFVMLWTATIVSLVNTSGSISKYYLFRINTVGALIFYIYVIWWTIRYYPKFARKAGYVLFFLFFIPMFIGRTSSNIRKNYLKEPKQEYIELIDFIRNNTNPEDVVIEEAALPTGFMRRIERESFVVKKLVPGGGEKIYEWYVRMESLLALRNDINYLDTIKTDYQINYLISDSLQERSDLVLKYQNSEYKVYQIINAK